MSETNGMKKFLAGLAIVMVAPLLLQSGMLFWWIGAMSARMNNAEKDIEHVEVRLTHLERK